MSFRKKYNQLQTSSLLDSYSSLLPLQPLLSISHHEAHICDNDKKVCAGNNIVGNKSRQVEGAPSRMGGGGMALWIINATDSVRTWQNILLNMLNKTGEKKAVIIWKQAVRLLESPLPEQLSRLRERKRTASTVLDPALTSHPYTVLKVCDGIHSSSWLYASSFRDKEENKTVWKVSNCG